MCDKRYQRYKQARSDSGSATAGRPRTLSEWFEHGRRCFHQPDGVEALAAFEKVTRLHPGYRHSDGDNPYFYLGKVHEVEGRLFQAIVFYTRALAVDPLDEASLIGRGTCYTVTYRHEAAIYDFECLLRFPTTRRSIPEKHLFFMLAENYRRLNRRGEALFWEERAKAADPGFENHRLLYGALVDAARRKKDIPKHPQVGYLN
jgi:tetratricopeptide (TPR) repeat protein